MSLDIIAVLGRIANGDEVALAEMYAEYATPVYSLARRVLQNDVLAQEATQDTFLKVWHQPHAWDSSKGQFSSWLLTLARYTAIDSLRSESRRTNKNTELVDDLAADTEEAADLDSQQVSKLLHHLPDEQRQLIELAFYMGMTHSELAEKLNLPLGTVKTRLRLGLQKLRVLLADTS